MISQQAIMVIWCYPIGREGKAMCHVRYTLSKHDRLQAIFSRNTQLCELTSKRLNIIRGGGTTTACCIFDCYVPPAGRLHAMYSHQEYSRISLLGLVVTGKNWKLEYSNIHACLITCCWVCCTSSGRWERVRGVHWLLVHGVYAAWIGS